MTSPDVSRWPAIAQIERGLRYASLPTWNDADQDTALAALARLAALADAAADLESRVVSGEGWDVGEVFNAAGRLRAALAACQAETGETP